VEAIPFGVCSDKAYRGINVLALWVAAHRAGYTGGIWGTYRQWAERGCQVRRGERATTVVFWKQMGRRDDGEPSSDDEDLSHHDDRSGRARFVARG
jgi:antirestriction protein ArdC